MIKCPKCQLDNMPNTKFCHHCGYDFSKLSIMDRFPEYNFRPTTVKKLPMKIWLPILGVLMIFPTVYLSPLGIWALVYYFRYAKARNNFHHIADYLISDPICKRYYIVVKDSMFGLWDNKKVKMTIPCEYSYLSLEGNDIYLAEKDGEYFKVDKFNNRMK